MKPLKEKVNITLDKDILKNVRELAELDDRNLSQYINLVLRRHLHENGVILPTYENNNKN